MGKFFNPFPKKKTSPDPPGDEEAVLAKPTPQDALAPGERATLPTATQPGTAEGVQAGCSGTNTVALTAYPNGVLFKPVVWGSPPRCIAFAGDFTKKLYDAKEGSVRTGVEWGGWILLRTEGERRRIFISEPIIGTEGKFVDWPWMMAREQLGEDPNPLGEWQQRNKTLSLYHSHAYDESESMWQQPGHSSGDMENFLDPAHSDRHISFVTTRLGICAIVRSTETIWPDGVSFSGIAIRGPDETVLEFVHAEWVKSRVAEGRLCKFYVYFSRWPSDPESDHYVGLLGP